jgi:hypothetical protein
MKEKKINIDKYIDIYNKQIYHVKYDIIDYDYENVGFWKIKTNDAEEIARKKAIERENKLNIILGE